MSALLSFLGGSVFRMVWGELSSWINKRQDHAYEMDRMKLQSELDDKNHQRQLENLRLAKELEVKTIEVQRDAEISKIETDAWSELVKSTARQTGIMFLDVWNGAVRPFLATIAIGIVVFEVAVILIAGGSLNEWHRDLVSVILGIYIADRSLIKRGK